MKRIEFEGTTHEFPDDFSDEDIGRALSSAHPTQKPETSGSFESWGPRALAKQGMQQAAPLPGRGSRASDSLQFTREGRAVSGAAAAGVGALSLAGIPSGEEFKHFVEHPMDMPGMETFKHPIDTVVGAARGVGELITSPMKRAIVDRDYAGAAGEGAVNIPAAAEILRGGVRTTRAGGAGLLNKAAKTIVDNPAVAELAGEGAKAATKNSGFTGWALGKVAGWGAGSLSKWANERLGIKEPTAEDVHAQMESERIKLDDRLQSKGRKPGWEKEGVQAGQPQPNIQITNPPEPTGPRQGSTQPKAKERLARVPGWKKAGVKAGQPEPKATVVNPPEPTAPKVKDRIGQIRPESALETSGRSAEKPGEILRRPTETVYEEAPPTPSTLSTPESTVGAKMVKRPTTVNEPPSGPAIPNAALPIRDVLSDLRDSDLRQAAEKYGVDHSKYDFNKRDEGRHRVERKKLVDDLANAIPMNEHDRVEGVMGEWDKVERKTRPDRAREVIFGGAEGEKKPGTGPGAMLGRGSKLLMKAGPQTGPGRILYHGTSTDSIPSIQEKGLLPPAETGIIGKGSSEENVVNMTRDRRVAEFYANSGPDAENQYASPQEGAILHIQVPSGAIDNVTEGARMATYYRTGKWPEPKQHEGMYTEPGEFQIVRSKQNIPPELIKRIERIGKKER